MRTHIRTLLPAVVLAATGSVAPPAAVTAQDAVRSEAPAPRGWIGVSFEILRRGGEGVESILITDVRSDSPAASAGLRPGDRVIAINELRTPRELAALPERLQLRPGDPVEMMIERDGTWHRVHLQAAPRPQGFAAGRRIEVTLKADSIVDTWARSMDSLRLRLRSGEETEGIILRRAAGAPGEGGTLVRPGGDRGVQAPFEFFVFRGEAHDSLRHEMVELNAEVARLEESIAQRRVELRRIRDGRAERDVELRRLEAELDEATARSEAVEAAMAESARESAGARYGLVGEAPGADPLPAVAGEFRPLTPYLVGRNRVAGAQVVDLNPELARYFEATQGVLVVEVAPGTPAAMAGIRPGDVITRLDQVAVRSVEELRFGVSVAEDSLPITLIREGASRQVLLRR